MIRPRPSRGGDDPTIAVRYRVGILFTTRTF